MMRIIFAIALLLAGSVMAKPIPVILDTDVGNDIDDTFAIALLIRNPAFDVKLITTTDGMQEYRTKLVAKELTIAGRTDIPIGIGAGPTPGQGNIAPWVHDFRLRDYKGTVCSDGVDALIKSVKKSKQPMTVIAIGPLQTLGEALRRDPSIAHHARLVAMQGSVFKGYGGSPKPFPEWNVKLDVRAAQRVLSADWQSITITPTDTCALPQIALDQPRLEKLRASPDKLDRAILQAHAIWGGKTDFQTTSLMYDTVAIFLADPSAPDLVNYKTVRIKVTDDAMTIPTADGREMRVAVSWKNVEGFRDYLLNGLLPRTSR
jgi:inosine-uridine nucleoside N-ribohydrolase